MIRHIQRALVAAFAVLLVSIVPVLAHAELVESDPADGETVETPYTLRTTYTEELIDGSGIIVDEAAGDEVARGQVDPDDRTRMVVELPALDPGEYVARWTARTADGHTERGEISFRVGAPATPTPAVTPRPTPTAGPTTAVPTASPQPTSSLPAATPSPTATAAGSNGQPTAGGDVLLALALAAVAMLVLGVFLFTRSRR